MALRLLGICISVLCEMFIQIRQHFQVAVNEVYQIHHIFNAVLMANPVGSQRLESLLFVVVSLDGPSHLV